MASSLTLLNTLAFGLGIIVFLGSVQSSPASSTSRVETPALWGVNGVASERQNISTSAGALSVSDRFINPMDVSKGLLDIFLEPLDPHLESFSSSIEAGSNLAASTNQLQLMTNMADKEGLDFWKKPITLRMPIPLVPNFVGMEVGFTFDPRRIWGMFAGTFPNSTEVPQPSTGQSGAEFQRVKALLLGLDVQFLDIRVSG